MEVSQLSYYFDICETEAYQTKYLDYLLDHYMELRLPYPFPVTLSYIASPILMGKDAILAFNQDDELVGAMGYILGTGEQAYADTHVIQIQIVFINPSYRCTRLFLRGLQFFMERLQEHDIAVTEIRFWTPALDELRSLLGKFAERIVSASAAAQAEFGALDGYRMSYTDLLAYVGNFKPEAALPRHPGRLKEQTTC